MYGAIIGDVIGSIFEFNNHRSKDFPLFTKDMFFTDDTVMTLAVAKSIKENRDIDLLVLETVKNMKDFGKRYPHCSYGGRFSMWLTSRFPYAYDSCGNGSAMRVSYCGEVAETLEDAKRLAYEVTRTTHNHYEGIKGAEAVAVAIWMARHKYSKEDIVTRIAEEYYPNILRMNCDTLRKTYQFNETNQETVPQAFRCFFEGKDFEDVLRTAISIGGDSDTLAAIACSIAEAYYGVPKAMKKKVREYLPNEFTDILNSPTRTYSVKLHTGLTHKNNYWYLS